MLHNLQKKYPVIKEVRGKGLLVGVELDCDVASIIKRSMERGVLIASAGANVLRFVPPLIVTDQEINQVLDVLDDILREGT
jgi:acetylornithine/N-succinyldiaminopimelate aminotransferase